MAIEADTSLWLSSCAPAGAARAKPPAAVTAMAARRSFDGMRVAPFFAALGCRRLEASIRYFRCNVSLQGGPAQRAKEPGGIKIWEFPGGIGVVRPSRNPPNSVGMAGHRGCP